MSLRLFAHPLSSYCQKALIALYELNLPFDLQLLDSSNPEVFAKLLQLWPFGKFPVLVDGDQVVPEATLIIEHLDALAGGGHLVPPDPSVRAEMALMDRIFDNHIATPQQKTVLDRMRASDCKDPQGVQEAHALLDKSYAWLEGRLSGRTWAAGEGFTLADCGAAPMLFYADWVHPIAPAFPMLTAYLKRLRTRPSVARAIDEARPYRHLVPGGIPAHID